MIIKENYCLKYIIIFREKAFDMLTFSPAMKGFWLKANSSFAFIIGDNIYNKKVLQSYIEAGTKSIIHIDIFGEGEEFLPKKLQNDLAFIFTSKKGKYYYKKVKQNGQI